MTKPITCFSCQHGELRGDLFAAANAALHIECIKGHGGTPKRQDQCADFSREPGTDEGERPT